MQYHDTNARASAAQSQQKNFVVGQVFKPDPKVCGFHAATQLNKVKWLKAGPKLVYMQLTRLAAKNKDGVCWPSHEWLAEHLGFERRQIVRNIQILEAHGLIRQTPRPAVGGGRTSSRYEFLYHDTFAPKATNLVSESDISCSDQPKMSHQGREEKREIEERERDYDCPPRFRKNRESSPGVAASQSTSWLSGYPNVRNWLRQYMKEDAPDLPSEQNVIRIVQATGYAPESEIRTALIDLLRRGYDHEHVATYAWFVSAMEDYFTAKTSREQMRTPVGYHEWEERNMARGVA